MKDQPISQAFEFVWTIPADGFEWVRALPALPLASKGGRFLVERATSRVKGYKPLEAFTGLFRTFAETSPTQEAILRFANSYGSLGEPCSQRVVALATKKKRRPVVWGESLASWEREISLMRELIRLWEAAQAGDSATLARFVYWKNGEVSFVLETSIGIRDELLASPEIYPDRLARFRPGDVTQPAWYALRKMINEQLVKHVTTPTLLWNGRNELQLFMRPRTLNSALWLQFASAVGGNHAYKMCGICGTWFQVGPAGDKRVDALFCSHRCRQRKYREKNPKGGAR